MESVMVTGDMLSRFTGFLSGDRVWAPVPDERGERKQKLNFLSPPPQKKLHNFPQKCSNKGSLRNCEGLTPDKFPSLVWFYYPLFPLA